MLQRILESELCLIPAPPLHNCLSLSLFFFFGPSLKVGTGNPLQYSCLENFMDRGAWQATVHGVAKSRKRPSDQHTHEACGILVPQPGNQPGPLAVKALES